MRSYPWYTFISLDQPRILTNRGGQMCGQREPWHFSSPNTRCKDVSQLMQHNLSKQKSPRLQSLGAEDVVLPYVEHRWTSNFGSPTFLAFGQVARNSVRASAFATCAFRCPKKRIFSSQSCRFCEATYGVFICSTVGFHQQKGGWITSGSCLLNVTCNRPVMWFGFVKWQLKTAAIWWLTSGLGVARIWQSHIQEDSMISQTWWVWLEIVDLSPPFRMNHARNLRPTADPGKKTHDFIRLSTEWVSPMVGKA